MGKEVLQQQRDNPASYPRVDEETKALVERLRALGHDLDYLDARTTVFEAAATIERLAREVEGLREDLAKSNRPEWFYDGDGDMDRANFDVGEVVGSVLEWSEPGEYYKPRLIEVATAKPLPSIWVVARAYTDAEKEARDDDEPYDVQEFATAEEAKAALAALQQGATDGQ